MNKLLTVGVVILLLHTCGAVHSHRSGSHSSRESSGPYRHRSSLLESENDGQLISHLVDDVSMLERESGPRRTGSSFSKDADDMSEDENRDLKLISAIRKLRARKHQASHDTTDVVDLEVDREVHEPRKESKRTPLSAVRDSSRRAAAKARTEELDRYRRKSRSSHGRQDPDDEDEDEAAAAAQAPVSSSVAPIVSSTATAAPIVSDANEDSDGDLAYIKQLKAAAAAAAAGSSASPSTGETSGSTASPSPVPASAPAEESEQDRAAREERQRRHDEFMRVYGRISEANRNRPQPDHTDSDSSTDGGLATVVPRVDRLERTVTHVSQQADDIQKKQSDFESRVTSHVEWAGHAIETINNGLQETQTNVKKETDDRVAATTSLSSKQQELSDKHEQLVQRTQKLEDETKSLRSYVDDATSKSNNQLVEASTQSKADVSNLLKRLDDLQSKLSEQSAALAASKERAAKLDDKAAHQDEATVNTESKIATIQGLIDSLQQTVDAHSKKLQTLLDTPAAAPAPVAPASAPASASPSPPPAAGPPTAPSAVSPTSPSTAFVQLETQVSPAAPVDHHRMLMEQQQRIANMLQLKQQQLQRTGATAITEIPSELLPREFLAARRAMQAQTADPSAPTAMIETDGADPPPRVIIVHRPVSLEEYERLRKNPTAGDAAVHLTPEVLQALQTHAASKSADAPESLSLIQQDARHVHLAPAGFQFSSVASGDPSGQLNPAVLQQLGVPQALVSALQGDSAAGVGVPPPQPSQTVQTTRDIGGGDYQPCNPNVPGCGVMPGDPGRPVAVLPPIIIKIPSPATSVQIISPGTKEANEILAAILNTTCNMTLPNSATINLQFPAGITLPPLPPSTALATTQQTTTTSTTTGNGTTTPPATQPPLQEPVVIGEDEPSCCTDNEEEEEEDDDGPPVMPYTVPGGTLSHDDCLPNPCWKRKHPKKKPRPSDDVIVVDSWPVQPDTNSTETPEALIQIDAQTAPQPKSVVPKPNLNKRKKNRRFHTTVMSSPLHGVLLEYSGDLELAAADEYDSLKVPLAPGVSSANSPVDSVLPLDNNMLANTLTTPSPFLSDPSVAPAVAPEDYDPQLNDPLDNVSPQDVDALPLYDDNLSMGGGVSLLDIGDRVRRKQPIVFEDQPQPGTEPNFIDVISSNSEDEMGEADWRDKAHHTPAADAVEADADPGGEEWSMNEKPPKLMAEAHEEQAGSAKTSKQALRGSAFIDIAERQRSQLVGNHGSKKQPPQNSAWLEVDEFA